MMRAVFPDLKTGFEDMAVVRLWVYLLLLMCTVDEVEIRNCAGFCERERIKAASLLSVGFEWNFQRF